MSVTGPVCPPDVAVAAENRTVPKFASASALQLFAPTHWEGASTIQSAEETSTFERRLVTENRAPVLTFRMRSVT